MWWRWPAEVQTEHQNGEERGFKWLWTWNDCWCETGWSEYFKNCWSTGIFTHKHLYGLQRMVWKRENIQWAAVVGMKIPCWCQRRMGRLFRDDRKATVTKNHSLQPRYAEYISERTTRRTLKQMGYSSRRPHRVLLLSAKNKKRRLQFAQDHHNWTIEEWKNVAWSDESRFLLRHSDGRVRIWCKKQLDI